MGRGHVDYSKKLSNEDIETASIKVTDRKGDRVSLQCLKADKEQLPVYGIGCGSTCILLDATGVEDKVLIFHRTSQKTTGIWYAL